MVVCSSDVALILLEERLGGMLATSRDVASNLSEKHEALDAKLTRLLRLVQRHHSQLPQ